MFLYFEIYVVVFFSLNYLSAGSNLKHAVVLPTVSMRTSEIENKCWFITIFFPFFIRSTCREVNSRILLFHAMEKLFSFDHMRVQRTCVVYIVPDRPTYTIYCTYISISGLTKHVHILLFLSARTYHRIDKWWYDCFFFGYLHSHWNANTFVA